MASAKRPSWQVGIIDYPDREDPDGSEELLSILNGHPAAYRDFAEEYYETKVDISLIEQIYQHHPLTTELVKALNKNVTLEMLKDDIEEIGYPA